MVNEYGIAWKMPVNGGHYFDMCEHPLANAETVNEIENFEWPDPVDPGRFTGMKEAAEKITREQKKAYMLGRNCAGVFEMALWMRGYEKFLCDMILDENLTHALLNKITEIKMRYWEKALEAVGDTVLVATEADDLATQHSLMISQELYKQLIYPYHRKLFEFIKKKAKSKVYIFLHCDGACKPMIPLLMEAGVDILNPVQVNCDGMDTGALKKEFGKDITFWGALCDTQSVLPFGTPQQVREETKRRIEDLAPGGGWIAAPIHNIQSGVPIENILAMWEALKEYGCY